MSQSSGISEWRQAGPLIALITGTSILRRFISRCLPSQWIRSIRSIDGRAGNDAVLAVRADVVKDLRQFAMRQKPPVQRLPFRVQSDLEDAVAALHSRGLI